MGNSCCGVRTCVSKKKKRTVIEPLGTHDETGLKSSTGCDLDLALVHKRIIAMGFPSVGFEGCCYRNPRDDVVDFLNENFHDKYRVYNVCSETDRQYEPVVFGGRVFSTVQWPDHLPPTLHMLRCLVTDASRWLNADHENVAVVHCKAGKGRTGTVACCLLLAMNVCKTGAEAIDFYGKARAHDAMGVTIPSQKRYIDYFSRSLPLPALIGAAPDRQPEPLAPGRVLQLVSVVVHDGRFTHVHVFLREGETGKTRSRYSPYTLAESSSSSSSSKTAVLDGVHVQGDFCVCVAPAADWPCSCAMIWLHSDFILQPASAPSSSDEASTTTVISFKGNDIDGWKVFFQEKEQREKVTVELTFIAASVEKKNTCDAEAAAAAVGAAVVRAAGDVDVQ